MTTKIRKGQAPGHLERGEFAVRFRNSFVDPAFRAEDDAIARLEAIAWDAYSEGRKAPITRKAGPGYADPDYDLAVEWIETKERLERAQAVWANPATQTRALVICGSPRNDGTCPGEISKTFRLAGLVERGAEAGRGRGRLPRSQPAHLRIRPQDPSVQGLRVDGDAALSLAVQLLPESFAGPDQRLDERDLRALGGGARDRHRHADALVQHVERPEADDRSAGLRRRRQSRSDLHARQEAGRSEGARAEGLELPQAPRQARLWPGRPRRRGRHRGLAARPLRLARLDGPDRRRRPGPARSLHRLLRALRDEPRRARRRPGVQEETRNVARAVARATVALRKGELTAAFAALPRPRPK